ncbi:MAG TPA: hypothetical protein VJH03_22240 [Blastocatellia bacterium]|nr:hypothetical protein [Blastocatellia bacterium]
MSESKYDARAVRALKEVRNAVEALALPFMKQRKFNGILNAIEMQVEDGEYNPDVVDDLGTLQA